MAPRFVAPARIASPGSGLASGVQAQSCHRTHPRTADDKELPNIETVLESGKRGPTLQIRVKREAGGWGWGWGWGKGYQSGPVSVVIVTPKLTGLDSAGSGDIRVGPLQTPSLQL